MALVRAKVIPSERERESNMERDKYRDDGVEDISLWWLDRGRYYRLGVNVWVILCLALNEGVVFIIEGRGCRSLRYDYGGT